jgi:hypothetical protein
MIGEFVAVGFELQSGNGSLDRETRHKPDKRDLSPPTDKEAKGIMNGSTGSRRSEI